MRRIHDRPALATPLLLLAVAGCAASGGAPPEPVGEPLALAYTVPEINPAAYSFADTARFEIESGAMGVMRVLAAQTGTAELEFRPAGDDLRVSVRFPQLSATFENPGQGAARADQGAIDGDIGVRLGARGTVEVADTPTISPRLLRIAGVESLVRPLFVHLPGHAVAPGDTWVDSVTTEDAAEGTRTVARSVITSTVIGDTLIDGQRALVVRTEEQTELEVTGSSGGVDIEQRMSGSTQGTFIWDELRALLLERTESGDLTGTLELPGMNVEAMPVTGTVHRVITLRR